MIVQVTDFTGKYELHTGMYAQGNIQAYIDKYEVRYLRQLLGVELCNDFIADLDNQNIPRSANFLDIYNPFAYDSGYNFYLFNGLYEGTGQLLSDGIKEMLLGFIYFEYAKDLVNQMTPFGNVKPKSENSDVANTLFSMMYARYNEAITTYRAIQHYVMMNNPATGQLLQVNITNGGGNYTTQNDVSTSTNGAGTGAKFDIVDLAGVVDEVTIAEAGKGYKVGDVLTLLAGDADATLEAVYVGLGDYRKFKGIKKSTAYWL
jgi:hypothetical protein